MPLVRSERSVRPVPNWLRPYVMSYAGYHLVNAREQPRINLPAATVTLLLGWGEPLHILASSRHKECAGAWQGLLAGLRTTALQSFYTGTAYAVQVEFTPAGAYTFLGGVPMHQLAHLLVDPDDVFGPGWTATMTSRLAAAPDWTGRYAILDGVLAQRLKDGPAPSPVIVHAWAQLLESHGTVMIGKLSEAAEVGSRRLQALFREQIGLPAKTVARILRFQRALTLPSADHQSLACTAASCGYHDQSHLTRDFRALAGYTPAQFRQLTLSAIPGGASTGGGRLTDITTHHVINPFELEVNASSKLHSPSVQQG